MFFLVTFALCIHALVQVVTSQSLILTELADPKDKNGARFVEIYSSDGAGRTINNSSLYLLRWTNGNVGPTTSSAVSLNGLTIGSDHFLVICVPLAANYSFSGYPNNTCDKVASTGGPADSNGDDQIAIISGTPAGSYTIIDIYGVPGQQGSATNGHFFQYGHAVRVTGSLSPKSSWDANDWVSTYGAYNIADMTPRKWDNAPAIAPTVQPVTTTSSSKPSTKPTLSPTYNCDSTIQDVTSGAKTLGQRVTICTGFVTAIAYNGFFIQEVPTTAGISSGLFIFTGTIAIKPQTVGAGIKVTGSVNFYNGMMQLISDQYMALGTNKIFEPINITMPVVDFSLLHSFQGMLVNIVADVSSKIVVSEFYNLDRYGEVIVCAVDANIGRLFQYSSRNFPNVDGYSNHLDLLKRSCMCIDDNSNVQNPKPIRFGGLYSVDTDNFFLRGGQTVETLRGPLWINTAYNKYYYVATLKQQDLSLDFSSSPRVRAPDFTAADGDINLVSSNLLNYFTTLNVRGANTMEEFQRQAAKATVALTAMNADVFSFTELENSAGNPAVKDLVTRLNMANPKRLYVAVSVLASLDMIGTDQIKVDIVFDSIIFDLVGWAVLEDRNVSPDILHNSTLGCVYSCASRVPLAATLRLKSTGVNVTIVANHLKSKGNSANNALGEDLDQLDGAALFNHMRTLSVKALLRWLDTNPTGVIPSNIILAGDFNSYDKEDPVVLLKQNGYMSATTSFESFPYSYLFDGQFGDLDYIFIKNSSSHRIVRANTWHVNSDETDLIDYNLDYGRDMSLFNGTEPWRYSDHDPIVLKISLSNLLTLIPTTIQSRRPSTIRTRKPEDLQSAEPTRKPSSHPSSRKTNSPINIPVSCTDNPIEKFVLRINVTKSCAVLATRFSSRRRNKICSSTVSNAATICPDTCRGLC